MPAAPFEEARPVPDSCLVADLRRRIEDGGVALKIFQDLVLADYASGASPLAIAERYGVCRTYAAVLARRRGLPSRRPVPGYPRPSR